MINYYHVHIQLCFRQERLLAVIAAVQEELQALGEGLQRRASVAAARSTLELMQDTAHAMSKVRWLLCSIHRPVPHQILVPARYNSMGPCAKFRWLLGSASCRRALPALQAQVCICLLHEKL